ncbi:hypothetical protein ACJZL0_02190 [Wolbachia endosymbiont of Rhagoletis indifferens]
MQPLRYYDTTSTQRLRFPELEPASGLSLAELLESLLCSDGVVLASRNRFERSLPIIKNTPLSLS